MTSPSPRGSSLIAMLPNESYQRSMVSQEPKVLALNSKMQLVISCVFVIVISNNPTISVILQHRSALSNPRPTGMPLGTITPAADAPIDRRQRCESRTQTPSPKPVARALRGAYGLVPRVSQSDQYRPRRRWCARPLCVWRKDDCQHCAQPGDATHRAAARRQSPRLKSDPPTC